MKTQELERVIIVRPDFMKRWLISMMVLAAVVQLAACSSISTVESWEKGNLASPVMVRESSTHHASLEQHTYLSKEAAQGGYSIGAGGCGCN